MWFKIPLLIWLALSPIERAELLGGMNDIYFTKVYWCEKANVDVTIRDDHVEIVYKCKWRSCGYENQTTNDSMYKLQMCYEFKSKYYRH